MSSCNYHMINDGFEAIESKLEEIANSVSSVEIQAKIDELDIDLDNLERQLLISNKLKLLELIGIDVMTEEEQLACYIDIKNELFAPSASGGTMEEEEGEL